MQGVDEFTIETAPPTPGEYRAVQLWLIGHHRRTLYGWAALVAILLASTIVTIVGTALVWPYAAAALALAVIALLLLLVTGLATFVHAPYRSASSGRNTLYEFSRTGVRIHGSCGDVLESKWATFLGYALYRQKLVLLHHSGTAFFFPLRTLGRQRYAQLEEFLSHHLNVHSLFSKSDVPPRGDDNTSTRASASVADLSTPHRSDERLLP